MSKDDQCILVSTLSNKIRLFDKTSGELLSEYVGHKNKNYHIENCMNHECSQILSGSEDGNVYSWNVLDSKINFKLKHANDRTVHSLSYHPDLNQLLSAQEKFIYLWESDAKMD